MVLRKVLGQLGDAKLFQTTVRRKFGKSLFLQGASGSLTTCRQGSRVKGGCGSGAFFH